MEEGSWSFDISGLEQLAEDLRKVEKAAPEISMKWVRRAGQQFLKNVRKKTREVTKKHTGNLARGYRQKVVLQRGSLKSYESRINGGNGKAPHFHLVEKGHEGKVPLRGGLTRSIGRVEGRFMMQQTIDDWDNTGAIVPFAQAAIAEALMTGALD